MKITDERKEIKHRPNSFVNLAVGDAFETKSGEINIKLAAHHRMNNAYCIQSNIVTTYGKNTYAKKLDVELVIHKEKKE